ncbi:MAG: GNAT family N-acetyltransferase, partial [Chlamydiia bacterium]
HRLIYEIISCPHPSIRETTMIDALPLHFRPLLPSDPPVIEEAFSRQGWKKPARQYEDYLAEQVTQERAVIVAVIDGDFTGYVTVLFASLYAPFRERKIPEISDLNVLKEYQGRGIGRALIAEAEKLIAQRSPTAGIGVGLLRDYGPAQQLYIKLGYLPDGLGATYRYEPMEYGSEIMADDDLVLWMTKKL